jgi:hypothetical protein
MNGEIMYISGAILAFIIGFIGSMLQANWRRNDLHEEESLLKSYIGAIIAGIFWGLLSWIGVILGYIVYYKWYKYNR